MQLLQPEQLVVVFELVAYAQLVVAVLDVHEHQVHELPEDLLRAHTLQLAVAHEGHHHVQCELVLHLHLQLLSLQLKEDHLFSMVFKQDPAYCHERHENYEVHQVIV
jgi:hypothetical protein